MLFKFTDRITARTARAGLLFSGIGLLLVSPAFGDDATSCAPSCAPTCAPACAPACGTCTDCNACAKNYEDAEKKLSGEYNRLLGEAAACCGPACAESAAPTCDGGCAGDAACSDDCGCNFKLQDLLCPDKCGEKSPYEFGGWLSIGYQNNPDGAFCGNGPFLDDREWDNVNFNEVYLYSQKVAKSECGNWDWGYRADVIYGVDGNEAQSFGNEPGKWDFLNGWDHGIYEWAMPQLYAEIAKDNLSVKLGHFWTPTGYEVYQPSGNFFYSHQILWYNAEPFTHTGALGTYKVSDKLSVSGGWVLGWDTGFNQNQGGSQGLVLFTYNATENTAITYFNLFGDSGYRGDENVCQGVIVTQKWTEKWSSVHQLDVMGTNLGSDFATTGIVGDSVGMDHYLFYEINDKLKAGTRAEWLKADGVSYYTWTYGVNIKPTENLLIRPEVRHMWAPGVPGGPAGTVAANMADVYGNQTVFGIDAIVTF